MLLSLAKRGFISLTGVDYSENAVQLGRTLLSSQSCEAVFRPLDFLALDEAFDRFDLIIDKGTFDAISLMPPASPSASKAEHTGQLAASFKRSLSLLWAGAATRFVITSCNWTREELERLFGPEFAAVGQIEHPKFSFGGASGQVVTTLVFRRA